MKNHNLLMISMMGAIIVLAILLAGVGLSRLVPFLILLCPLSMIVMMWFMSKNTHKH